MTNMRAEEFELVTFGAGGRSSRHDIDRISAMLEVDDVARYSLLVQRRGEAGRKTHRRRPGTVRR